MLEIATRFDPAVRDFFCEAETFDIHCAVTVRHVGHGVTARTLVTDVRRARYLTSIRCNVFALQLLAQQSHERVCRLQQPDCLIEGIVFTHRELECLEWASRGKSCADISLITGLRYRQVVRALEGAEAKLGVRTTVQVVRAYAAFTNAKPQRK